MKNKQNTIYSAVCGDYERWRLNFSRALDMAIEIALRDDGATRVHVEAYTERVLNSPSEKFTKPSTTEGVDCRGEAREMAETIPQKVKDAAE